MSDIKIALDALIKRYNSAYLLERPACNTLHVNERPPRKTLAWYCADVAAAKIICDYHTGAVVIKLTTADSGLMNASKSFEGTYENIDALINESRLETFLKKHFSDNGSRDESLKRIQQQFWFTNVQAGMRYVWEMMNRRFLNELARHRATEKRLKAHIKLLEAKLSERNAAYEASNSKPNV